MCLEQSRDEDIQCGAGGDSRLAKEQRHIVVQEVLLPEGRLLSHETDKQVIQEKDDLLARIALNGISHARQSGRNPFRWGVAAQEAINLEQNLGGT
jgi:hypothetical protein